jgi:DNA polymerase III psi subunit
MQPKAQGSSRPRLPDRLHFALIRAAGCNPNAPGVAEVIAAWPTAEELRADPAAKRALWPRLRALRRPAPQ